MASLQDFIAKQEPLGEEFEKVLFDNLDTLYIEDPISKKELEMNTKINYEPVINELIKGVKLNTQNDYTYECCREAISLQFLIEEIHTVGLKVSRQTGLTSCVKEYISTNNNACVITDMPKVYEGVSTVNTKDDIRVQLKDCGYTTFFIDKIASHEAWNVKVLYPILYEKAGKDLVIIEIGI